MASNSAQQSDPEDAMAQVNPPVQNPLPRSPRMTQPTIGIISRAPRSGKSTAADYLCERYGYQRRPLANTIREMLLPFLVAFGYDKYQARYYLTTAKEERLALIPGAPTARHLLQTLGAEWGRSCVAPSVWLDIWLYKTANLPLVLSDDVRYLNEVAMIRSRPNPQIWRITRPGVYYDGDHSSEGELDSIEVDAEIINDGTIADLHAKIDQLLKPQ